MRPDRQIERLRPRSDNEHDVVVNNCFRARISCRIVESEEDSPP